MALDKLVDSTQLDADLTSVANAIRTKGGTSASLAFPAGFVSAIGDIPTGGGGGIPLLKTITVPADTRAVSVDFSDYQDLDIFFVVIDFTISASDWLYFVKDGSSPSGGNYCGARAQQTGLVFAQVNPHIGTASGIATVNVSGGTFGNGGTGAWSSIYLYTYRDYNTIKAGSTVKIYGGNYADM